MRAEKYFLHALSVRHRKIRLIECYVKRQKLTCKGTLRQGVYLSEAPYPPRFFLGRCSNFVGSEFGQKQSAKLLSCRI
jgi:hypothetical protein